MRLKPEKVEFLAGRIAEGMKHLKNMQFLVPQDQVAGAVRRVILGDLQREDQIEKEAEEILRQYRQKIDLRNLSYSTLLSRAKQEIARKKKIIL
jgi:hypothetical protein